VAHSQLSLQEILRVLYQRRKIFFLPIILITVLSTVGAFVIERKYESAATILVQRDEILNPLVSYEMAVAMASEDMLKTFNEIIYSTSTLQTVIDTLHIVDTKTLPEDERQKLFKEMRKDIITERPGSSAFKIAYLDADPYRAQKVVLMLSNLFIRTILQVENRRNEQAVYFFETKLEELRQRFERTQEEMLAQLTLHIQQLPGDKTQITKNLEESSGDIYGADLQMQTYNRALTILRAHPEPMLSPEGRDALHDVQLMNMPYGADLRILVTKYDDLARKYTGRYPGIEKLVQQIHDMVKVMSSTIEKEIDKIRSKRLEAERRHSEAISDLQKRTVSQRADEDKESNFTVYRDMYNDMKVKLEQARATRDLGRQQKDRFMIIDPPLVPTEPSKPNRLLIILGGLGSSLIVGFFSVAAAELMDTRMRRKQDFATYQKPIIAYIPDGRSFQ